MKKVIKTYAAMVVCVCAIVVTSCSQNPVDKKLNELDAMITKLENISKKDNPSFEEMKSLQNDYEAFQQSLITSGLTDLREKGYTADQRKKMLAIMTKVQNLQYSPLFQNIRQRRSLNY